MENYLMNVGELKGSHITALLAEVAPKISVELGGYVGYSTILFGNAVKQAAGEGARYYCLEYNPTFAAVIMALVDLAGLADVVKVPPSIPPPSPTATTSADGMSRLSSALLLPPCPVSVRTGLLARA